jgi:Predicted restriction endonuclease
MSFNEEQRNLRKEFCSFLSLKMGKKGQMLAFIIAAADNHIKEILKKWYNIEISCLYDSSLSIEELIRYSLDINSNDEILASSNGYISGQAVDLYCSFIADKDGLDINAIKDSIRSKFVDTYYLEGTEREKRGIIYERDTKARAACIKHYGCKCVVCGMDFEYVYGALGKGFIEVHHIIPISERCGEYIVDPINDLRPLCSNCHSMIHRSKDVLSINDLKKIIMETSSKE